MKIVLFLAAILFVSIIPVSFSETITIDTEKEEFAGGEIVELKGNMDDGKAGDLVAIEIKDPTGKTILIRTVTLGEGGSYYLKFKIPESAATGSYDIISNSQPVSSDNSVQSNTENTSGGGCLIATATYGSELAPQVQQLREIRDNTVMSTSSGAAFMTGFNQLYYSFSPYIADLERENPLFQKAVRLYITPMISTLSIMTLADAGDDAQVLGFGISVIVLNLGIYLVAPTLIGFTIHRQVTSRK